MKNKRLTTAQWNNLRSNRPIAVSAIGQCYVAWVKRVADKTHILEHDEQSPPQYWCRKVQP